MCIVHQATHVNSESILENVAVQIFWLIFLRKVVRVLFLVIFHDIIFLETTKSLLTNFINWVLRQFNHKSLSLIRTILLLLLLTRSLLNSSIRFSDSLSYIARPFVRVCNISRTFSSVARISASLLAIWSVENLNSIETQRRIQNS